MKENVWLDVCFNHKLVIHVFLYSQLQRSWRDILIWVVCPSVHKFTTLYCEQNILITIWARALQFGSIEGLRSRSLDWLRKKLDELCPFLSCCMNKHIVGGIVFYKHTYFFPKTCFGDSYNYLAYEYPQHIEGWAQEWRKSDGCFSPNLISSPWRCYEDYNISFCKQWKFRCHCSYEQWHLNLHCLQRGPSCP